MVISLHGVTYLSKHSESAIRSRALNACLRYILSGNSGSSLSSGFSGSGGASSDFANPLMRNSFHNSSAERDRLTVFSFVEALKDKGYQAKLVERRIKSLSEEVFPVVAIMNDNRTVIITHKNSDGAMTVLNPENGQEKIYQDTEYFNSIYSGMVVLFSGKAKTEEKGKVGGSKTLTESSSPQKELAVDSNQWFWDILAKFKSLYWRIAGASLMINILGLASPLFVMNVYDRVVPSLDMQTLWILASAVTVAFTVDFVLKNLRGYFVDVAGKGADILISSRLYKQLLGAKNASSNEGGSDNAAQQTGLAQTSLAQNNSAGAVANRMKEFENLREFFTSSTITSLIDLPFVFLFAGAIYMVAGSLVLIPLLSIPILLIVNIFVKNRIEPMIGEMSQAMDDKQAHLIETLGAVEDIKALNATEYVSEKWSRYIGKLANSAMKMRVFSLLGVNLSVFLQQLVTAGVVVYGVYLIANGSLSVGGLVACTILTGKMISPLNQLVSLYSRFSQSKYSLQSLSEIMNSELETSSDEDGYSNVDGNIAKGKKKSEKLYLPYVKGEISLQGVNFAYEDKSIGNLQTLTDTSFRIRAGEKVAILGKMGAGKSTVLRMILNLYPAKVGKIFIDGVEINQLEVTKLRDSIAYVPQNPSLFKGTVRENILMGQTHVSMDKLQEICKSVGLEDFVNSQPNGIDTMVGDGGKLLSGGQKQAVAIARALIKESASIVLMDEPTSNLDMETEHAVVKMMQKTLADKTVIVVTHRPSMLDLIDRVILMDKGQVVADGIKNEVLENLKNKQIRKAG